MCGKSKKGRKGLVAGSSETTGRRQTEWKMGSVGWETRRGLLIIKSGRGRRGGAANALKNAL
jgi:hypothetical protein